MNLTFFQIPFYQSPLFYRIPDLLNLTFYPIPFLSESILSDSGFAESGFYQIPDLHICPFLSHSVLSDSVIPHNKVKSNKCPQCWYSLSDSGYLSKNIKCAPQHIIVDEICKIERRKQYLESQKILKNREKITSRPIPSRNRIFFRSIPSRYRPKSKCPSRRGVLYSYI
jgi:hypothetical protein